MLFLLVNAELVPPEEMSALSALHRSTVGHSWSWRPLALGMVWDFRVDEEGNYLENPCSSGAVSHHFHQSF